MLETPNLLYSERMKNVLIPTDFSSQSRYSLEYILDFLQHSTVPAKILLVNTYIVEMNSDPSQLVTLNDELKKKSKAQLEQEVLWARSQCMNPLVSIEAASHMGSLNNVILNILRREKIDMVAIGKGNGSHFEQVSSLLKKQGCPILITHKSEFSQAIEA